ncbi:NrsF family protein [Blastomonas sp.]|uniref:NrsF family protein n=1 Tax=Blastomonas sp. TaxID=1909299 RepID=UPI0035931C0B
MRHNSDALIADLVGKLEPVKPLSFARGISYALGSACVAALAVTGLFGVRADLLAGDFDPVYLLATGLFLMLGIAAAVTVIVMSRPQVGNDHGGWVWAAAMVTLLPIAAVIISLGGGSDLLSRDSIVRGLECLMVGGAASFLVFSILVAWLRQGAPTAPDRAGLLSGIAAGSLGVFAFSLHCADNDIVHIGLWHSSVVLLMALLGRAVVPPLVRW